MYGYSGCILHVDLSTEEIKKEELEKKYIDDFIGGLGINIRLAHDFIRPGVDPLSPQNPIIIGAGPLVGTIVPSSCRSFITTKMPMNGAVGWGGGAMNFGPMLKYAGYDHVIIKGRSEKPVYLKINDDEISIEDASNLWGKDIVQTSDELWKLNGDCGIISIGQAGENLVKFSIALVDRISTVGRGGFGAVMGSKNLKAIVAKGSKGVKVYDPKRLMKIYNNMFERIRTYPKRDEWVKFGLIKTAELVSKEYYVEKLKKARIACPSCPIGDKDVIELREGRFSGLISYQTSVINSYMLLLIAIGSDNEMVKAFDSMNRYGLDAITITNIFPLLKKLYKLGTITDEDTGGLVIKGDYDTFARIIEDTTFRRGLGKFLADGFNGFIKKFGDEFLKKFPIIKGQSLILDPKILNLGTMEFEQFLSPRGAHDVSGGSPTYFAPGRKLEEFKTHFDRMGIPEEAIGRIFKPPIEKMGLNIGRVTRYSEDWFTALASLGTCARAQINRFYSAKLCAEFYSAVTGIEIDREKLLEAAERSWNLLRLMNMREGFTRNDDEIPEALLRKRIRYYHGDVKITKELANQLLDDYYDERGWNIDDGIPKKEKIFQLRLENLN